MFKKKLVAAAALALAAGAANAVVICDACDFIPGAAATYLGAHDPDTFDNSTFANSTTGQNGDFSNLWVFNLEDAGRLALDTVFLPIQNISNFDVQLFDVSSFSCAPNTGITGGACASVTLGSMIGDGLTPTNYVSLLDGVLLDAGNYAFRVTGTISGLEAGQPASYAGNLQTQAVSAVPEPETYSLFVAGLAALAYMNRRRKNKNNS